MKFQILSLFPDFFQSCLQVGLLQKAIQKKIIKVDLIDIKKFTKKGRADDYPFGGGDSMLIAYEPLKKALKSIKKTGPVVYLSPQGQKWTAQKAKSFSQTHSHVSLLCGRYGGIDARFIREFVDEEVSIGDYVLNGGETASLVFIETCSRFIEGFMGNKESHQKDSFEDFLLESPSWTKPRLIKGHSIPEVILSGNHKKIKEFRYYSSLLLSWLKRPELVKQSPELLKDISLAQAHLKKLSKKELESLGLSLKGDELSLLK